VGFVHLLCRILGVCKKHVWDTPEFVRVRRCGQLVVLVELALVDVVAEHVRINEKEILVPRGSFAGGVVQELWEGLSNEKVQGCVVGTIVGIIFRTTPPNMGQIEAIIKVLQLLGDVFAFIGIEIFICSVSMILYR